MDSKNFCLNLFQTNLRVPEIEKQILLTEQGGGIESWLDNNPSLLSSVKPSGVSKYLTICATKMISKNIPVRLVQNVYSEEGIKYAILANQSSVKSSKALYKKLSNIFYSVLINSSNFEIYYKKPMKHARTTVIEPNRPVELFWLIPLLMNPTFLTKVNIDDTINVNIELSRLVPEYVEGYDVFVYNVTTESKENYKQFLADSAMIAEQG